MRYFLFLFTIFSYCLPCLGQTIINPIFDRTDTPKFHVDRVELQKDSTLLFCTYTAEPGSWANISMDTYIEDIVTQRKFKIIKSEGLPFYPSKRIFSVEEKVPVILHFKSIGYSRLFNLIENSSESVFNIYGINLDAPPYPHAYSDYEVLRSIRQQEFYSQSGNIEKAISYCKSSLDGKRYLFGLQSPEVGKSLYILASLYYQIGCYREAIDIGKEGLAIDLANNLIDEDLALDYNNLSHSYSAIGDYRCAIEMAMKSKSLLAKTDTISESYAAVLTNLSKFSNSLGNYSDALLYAKQSLFIKERTAGLDSESYAISLSNYATAVSNLGNYEEAINSNKKCLDTFLKFRGEDDIANATIWGNLSYNYANLSNYHDAIICGEKACKIFTINNIENDGYLSYLSNISYYYFQLACTYEKQVDNAQIMEILSKSVLFSDSAQHVAKRINESYLVLPTLYNNKASLFSLQGKLDEAIEEQRKACDLSDKSTLEYTELLQNLSLLYLFSGNRIEALKIEKDVIELLDYRINKNLQSTSAFYRSKYWSTLNDLYNNFIPKCAFHTMDKGAISYFYDKTALLAKGFLLNSNIGIREILINERDSAILATMNEIQNLYAQLDDISIMSPNYEEREHIINEIEEKESDLVSKSSAYRVYIDRMNCNWQSVQERLTTKDIAIEFLKCPLGLYNDSVLYVALLLKKQYESPLLIPLCNEQELVRTYPLLSIEKLYELIWRPLESELNDVENIYFSPAGLLYNIGIEYLPYKENLYMIDKYNMFRLSSTRELVNKPPKGLIPKAALFGNISYDMTQANDVMLDHNDKAEFHNRSIASAISDRSGFDKLSGTIKEIEEVAAILNKNGIVKLIYSNENGSEYNFKKLSGENWGIIHLATHGMYVDFESAEINVNQNNFAFISLNNSTDISGESRALTRSFLVMAGGNRLPRRQSIPIHGNDGILTALEISRLNLQSVDLVVLSACQSGLGDVSDEGVLGLQRGFKKAGVNTIIMSLDKVDDEATKILMVEFYRNLMNGKTKHQSLKDAQKNLRQVDNGKYDKPEYWASFIMLDGLN